MVVVEPSICGFLARISAKASSQYTASEYSTKIVPSALYITFLQVMQFPNNISHELVEIANRMKKVAYATLRFMIYLDFKSKIRLFLHNYICVTEEKNPLLCRKRVFMPEKIQRVYLSLISTLLLSVPPFFDQISNSTHPELPLIDTR